MANALIAYHGWTGVVVKKRATKRTAAALGASGRRHTTHATTDAKTTAAATPAADPDRPSALASRKRPPP
jgi:hypothetical protein